MSNSLLELNKIGKSYLHGKKEDFYIKDVSFQLKKGEIISILGPSGCGKTTILKLVGGILQPSEGKIYFSDNNHYLGYVPQSPSLMPNRTVYENVSLILEIKKDLNKKNIESALQKVGMLEYQKYYPHQLSGGMQQKVALARALVLKPNILLMDEPFSSIDEISRWKFNFDLINLLKNNALSVLFVTHSIEEAVFLSDRILTMSLAKPTTIDREILISFGKQQRDRDLISSEEYLQQVIKVRGVLEEKHIL